VKIELNSIANLRDKKYVEIAFKPLVPKIDEKEYRKKGSFVKPSF